MRLPPIVHLAQHLSIPLFRNGYALVVSSVATSALGILYWALAAHNYSPDVVGLNSAALSIMVFIAYLAQLNLVSILNRFIPTAGRATIGLVLIAYGVNALLAALLAWIFIMGSEIWAPSLNILWSEPWQGGWFLISTACWSIFVLQDGVLAGLRQTIWVPVENIAFGFLKICLLIIVSPYLTNRGILDSWSIAAALMLLPVNFLIFTRLIPKHRETAESASAKLDLRQVLRLMLSDYIGSLIYLMATTLLPIAVVEIVGAEANAYFYLAWKIAYALYLVSGSMGISLVAEAATNESSLAHYCKQTTLQSARLVIPFALGVVLSAPLLLRLFGQTYAENGAMLLQLLCLSAIPNIVTAVAISKARVQKRGRKLMLIWVVLAGLVLGLSLLLLPLWGIAAVGAAWLVGQAIVAGVLLLTDLRDVWLPKINMARFKSRFTLAKWYWQWQHKHYRQQAQEILLRHGPILVPEIGTDPDAIIIRVIETSNDTAVLALEGAEHERIALLKLPQSAAAVVSLQRQLDVLQALRADMRLDSFHSLLPRQVCSNLLANSPYVLEKPLPGADARSLLINGFPSQDLLPVAIEAIQTLHSLTKSTRDADAELLRHLITEPIAQLRQLQVPWYRRKSHLQALNQLEARLISELAGRKLTVSWIHGDFSPGNVLCTPDGTTVTGIIDWDLASPCGLPAMDLWQFYISVQVIVQAREMGDVVNQLLRGLSLAESNVSLLKIANRHQSDEVVSREAQILLTWLKHVSANLKKSNRYQNHWYWQAKNIECVLMGL